MNTPTDKIIPGIIYGLLAAIGWGLSPVVTRFGVIGSLDPYDVTALRFLAAGVILLPLVLRKRLGDLSWGATLIMSVGAGVPFILLVAGGVVFASAAHAGTIIPSVMLTCSMLGGWLMLGDRPSMKRLIGYGVVLIGIALIGGESMMGGIGPNAWIGDLMFVGAGFFWAVYTVTARAVNAEPLHATALVAVISMVLYLPAYFLWKGGSVFSAPVSEILIQAGFQGIVNAILALFFYTRAVKYLGAARGSIFAALVPGLAVLFAYPILGEAPSTSEFAGVLVVSAGMVYALGLTRGTAKA